MIRIRRDYLVKLTSAFLITAVGGFIATRLGFKLPEAIRPIAVALIIGGIAILVIEQLIAGATAEHRGDLDRRGLRSESRRSSPALCRAPRAPRRRFSRR